MRLLLRAAVAGALTASALVTATPAAHAETVSLPLSEAVAALPVAEEDRTGYDRDEYRHWVDDDRDGCNTRAEVLLRDATVTPEVTGRCTITAGTGEWYSWYDEATQTDKGDIDIDHMVPLAESWDSGASAWSADERRAYANDLGDDRSLLAVTDRVNQAKGDQDPAEWMPPAESATCRYIADWTAVKVRWGLAVDPTELSALTDTAAGCEDVVISVELAR